MFTLTHLFTMFRPKNKQTNKQTKTKHKNKIKIKQYHKTNTKTKQNKTKQEKQNKTKQSTPDTLCTTHYPKRVWNFNLAPLLKFLEVNLNEFF